MGDCEKIARFLYFPKILAKVSSCLYRNGIILDDDQRGNAVCGFLDHSVVKKVKVLVCVSTLCDPMDCSPPGSSVLGISQVRILE